MITPIGPTVHHVAGPAAGWGVLTDGPPGPRVPFTLVDAGYPGYADRVRVSIERIGLDPAYLAAVVVTHGHVDHVGAIPALLGDLDHAVPVLTSGAESAHVRGEVHESAGAGDITPRLLQHGVAAWAWHLLRNQALAPVSVAAAEGVADGEPLDVPGHPVPMTTPGHTSGHTCYLLPQHGAVFTGDALVTGHPLSRIEGPQVLRDFFHHDTAAMLDALPAIGGADADVLLPGHGPVWRGPANAAATLAKETALAALAGKAR